VRSDLTCGLQVILMSGLLDGKTEQAALALGVKACLQKPFSFQTRLSLVDQKVEVKTL